MKFCVDPQKGLANSPDVVLLSDEFPHIWEDKTYWRSGPCYWHQNRQTGQTLFLFHTPDLLYSRPGKPRLYVTNDGGGFGGATFKLKVYNMYGIVHVVGPWSGGCYCANQYLPKHCIEVRRYDSKGSSHSLCLPIDMVNDGLRGTGWEVMLQPNRYEYDVSYIPNYGKEIRYEAMYKGNNKDLFSKDQMDDAHTLYQEAAGRWLQDLQSQFRNKMLLLQENVPSVGSAGSEEPGSDADEEEHTSLGREDVWFD